MTETFRGIIRHRNGSLTSNGSIDLSFINNKKIRAGSLSGTGTPRSGSISGRLRAASDLEDLGWIDKSQKGLIKDLIISGDLTLQSALDKYECGDSSELEGYNSVFNIYP